MIRKFMIAAASAAVLALSPTTFAQQPKQYGNADEARAMLLQAVAVVKADKTKALDTFTKGEGGFLDRDLYVFCSNVADGKVVDEMRAPSPEKILERMGAIQTRAMEAAEAAIEGGAA